MSHISLISCMYVMAVFTLHACMCMLQAGYVLQCRYDFHRGVDIPLPLYTNVYAIDDGIVTINGSSPAYRDGIVQVHCLV